MSVQAQRLADRSPAEAVVIARAQAGDREAFGELYTLHLPAVRRYLRAQLWSCPADADDVAAEVFMAAMRSIGTYRGVEHGGAAFGTWLYGIARRRLHGRIERSRREAELRERLCGASLAERPPNAEEIVVDRVHVAALLATLPARRRRVLTLRHLLDMPVADVAEAMRTTGNAVSCATHAARTKLRAASAGTGPPPRTRRRMPARRPLLEPRQCACGCGAWLPLDRQAHQVYARTTCGNRVWVRRRQEDQRARLVGDVAEDPAVYRALRAIAAAGDDGITRKDLNRRLRLLGGRLDRIVDHLSERGQVHVRIERDRHSRRPITRYFASAERAEAA